MSKKNRFRKHRATHIAEDRKESGIQKVSPQTDINNYNMLADFKWLFAIIFFYTGIVVALYYYDNQTQILSSLADKFLSLI